MSKRRPRWRVRPNFGGWIVEAMIWRRPSKGSPDGYHTSICAPGGPFPRDEALRLAEALTARGSRSGRLPEAAP